MGKIKRIHVLEGKKTSLQKQIITEALRAGIPVLIPENEKQNDNTGNIQKP